MFESLHLGVEPHDENNGLKLPKTQEELLEYAKQLNDPDNEFYGIALLGAKGPAVAQDYMAWVQQHGSTILDENGNPALNTPKNVEILEFFGELFNYAPPGATDYWWDQRETAFRSGNVAMMEGWSIARAGYENPDISSVVGKVDITTAPVAEGMEPKYGFGGWGIGINADSENAEAAWEFIKWLSEDENMGEFCYQIHNVPPKEKPATEERFTSDPRFVLAVTLLNGPNAFGPDKIPVNDLYFSRLNEAESAVFEGQLEAQEALDRVTEEVQKELDDALERLERQA